MRDEADIVIGKVVGEGKFVARSVFKRDRKDVTLEWAPLVRLLTPHKLFRKSLLDEHGIRFPEGRRRLEDHVFVMHAYFHARQHLRPGRLPLLPLGAARDGRRTPPTRSSSPVGYYENVREVLDLIDEHMEPGPLRDRVRSHWYRGKMLGRVGGRNFLERDPAFKRPLYEEVRKLALERYGEEVDEYLAFNARIRSHLLRAGDYEGLDALAAYEGGLETEATVVELEPEEEEAVGMVIEARIAGLALRARRRAGALGRRPPSLAGHLTPEERDVTDAHRPQLRRRARSGRPATAPSSPAHGHRDAARGRHAGAHRAGAARSRASRSPRRTCATASGRSA